MKYFRTLNLEFWCARLPYLGRRVSIRSLLGQQEYLVTLEFIYYNVIGHYHFLNYYRTFDSHNCMVDLLLQEILRIKAEHIDDSQAVMNDRVKGQLKVTRAFGAGFLKKVS